MLETDALARRVTYYRRAFRRVFTKGTGVNPNAFQRAVMRRAVMLAAQADIALTDPAVSLNDRVRLCGAADRAHASMVKAFDQRARNAPNEFQAYLAEHQASAG